MVIPKNEDGYKGRTLPTLLLVNVKIAAGEIMCDHLWFNLTKTFATRELCPGDVVQFDGRVNA